MADGPVLRLLFGSGDGRFAVLGAGAGAGAGACPVRGFLDAGVLCRGVGDAGLFSGEAAVLLALLGEFGLYLMDVVLPVAQSLVLLGDAGFRCRGAFQRFFLLGETAGLFLQPGQRLLGAPPPSPSAHDHPKPTYTAPHP